MAHKELVLEHYGVKGMKWGVRRYHNKDGSLNDKGRKKVSKEYSKLSKKIGENRIKNYSSTYVKTYNKVANEMNEGGLEKHNKKQEKKYGKDFAKRDDYVSSYETIMNKKFEKYMNIALKDIDSKDPNFQKAKQMIKDYDMTKWDGLAKQNMADLAEREAYINRK